ncbi:MAG: hypothetical protein ACRDZ5_06885 [Acidimicrobiales bacterium]
MAAPPQMAAGELGTALRHVAPPTTDDVTILRKGRRGDSLEQPPLWLGELAAERASDW